MSACHHHPTEGDLTRNQRLVLDALRADGGPLTAYALLDGCAGMGCGHRRKSTARSTS